MSCYKQGLRTDTQTIMKKLLILLSIAFVLGAFTNQWLDLDITASDAHAAAKLAGLDMTDVSAEQIHLDLSNSHHYDTECAL